MFAMPFDLPNVSKRELRNAPARKESGFVPHRKRPPKTRGGGVEDQDGETGRNSEFNCDRLGGRVFLGA